MAARTFRGSVIYDEFVNQVFVKSLKPLVLETSGTMDFLFYLGAVVLQVNSFLVSLIPFSRFVFVKWKMAVNAFCACV
jgi:hypothetical protein